MDGLIIALGVFLTAVVGLTMWKTSQHRLPPIAERQPSESQAQRTVNSNYSAQQAQSSAEQTAPENNNYPAKKVNGSSHSPKDENENYEKALANYTFWLTAFTAILAVSTVGLVVATVGLWSYAAEQASDMKDAIAQSRRSADAATQASNATLGLERPFFHILKADLLRPNGEHDPSPLVDFSFFNAGRTAAIVREMNFDCRMTAPLLPAAPPYDLSKTGTTRMLVAATGHIGSTVPDNPMAKCTFREPFKEADYVDLKNGGKIIIFFGFIKYEGMLNFVYTKGFGAYY